MFLDHPVQFRGPAQGTFTFSARGPYRNCAAGIYDKRGEFLFSTIPVTEIQTASQSNTADASCLLPKPTFGSNVLLLPHFADGGGWKTQVI